MVIATDLAPYKPHALFITHSRSEIYMDREHFYLFFLFFLHHMNIFSPKCPSVVFLTAATFTVISPSLEFINI